MKLLSDICSLSHSQCQKFTNGAWDRSGCSTTMDSDTKVTCKCSASLEVGIAILELSEAEEADILIEQVPA